MTRTSSLDASERTQTVPGTAWVRFRAEGDRAATNRFNFLLKQRTKGRTGQPSAQTGLVVVVGTFPGLSLELPGHQHGKVRESWILGSGHRLLVTTDRLSAFDSIIGLVPHKGQVLNQVAAWWFEQTADIIDNHVVSLPDPNALVALDASPLPIEVIVRGRLTGSTSTALLPRYLAGERTLYGHRLPDGIEPHGLLPEPIITPTTKAQDGAHDEPITVDDVVARGLVEPALWEQIQDVALQLFARGSELAATAGFVLADTKYEFGLGPDGQLLLIDEIHTPDSSRFWEAATLDQRLADGLVPESFDKEPVRLALLDVGFGGDGDIPTLPDNVWLTTSSRYVSFFERLTGTAFVPGDHPIDQRIRAAVASVQES